MNFITGNSFKDCSNFIFDEYGFRQNKPVTNNKTPMFFVKTDYIDMFFTNKLLLPNYKFKLITHNSDYQIDNKYLSYVNNPNLEIWFAQNVNLIHKKLIPIPIGIANAEWPHGNIELLQKVMNSNYAKKKLLYANFNVTTNLKQRKYCLQHIPNEYIENDVSFETYLQHTAESYYSICPLGNGIDSHRIWESLYLRTVPIVEKTYNISYMANKYNIPVIILEDWLQLDSLGLGQSTYNKTINNFCPKSLDMQLIMSVI